MKRARRGQNIGKNFRRKVNESETENVNPESEARQALIKSLGFGKNEQEQLQTMVLEHARKLWPALRLSFDSDTDFFTYDDVEFTDFVYVYDDKFIYEDQDTGYTMFYLLTESEYNVLACPSELSLGDVVDLHIVVWRRNRPTSISMPAKHADHQCAYPHKDSNLQLHLAKFSSVH